MDNLWIKHKHDERRTRVLHPPYSCARVAQGCERSFRSTITRSSLISTIIKASPAHRASLPPTKFQIHISQTRARSVTVSIRAALDQRERDTNPVELITRRVIAFRRALLRRRRVSRQPTTKSLPTYLFRNNRARPFSRPSCFRCAFHLSRSCRVPRGETTVKRLRARIGWKVSSQRASSLCSHCFQERVTSSSIPNCLLDSFALR